MYQTLFTTIMKKTAKLASGFRKTISIGLVAITAVGSLMGCNGKIYAALFDTNLMQYLPFLGPKIVSITIDPAIDNTPSGVPVDYDITVTFDNGKMRELTKKEMDRVTWTWDPTGGSLDIDILSVDITNVDLPGVPVDTITRVTATNSDYDGGNEEVTLTADYKGFTATTVLTINNAWLEGIDIIPATASITKLATQQFMARCSFSDDSTHDIPSLEIPTATWLVWDSSPLTVATIDSTGKASAIDAGTATITADIDSLDPSCPLTAGIVPGTASLEVTAPNLSRVTVSPIIKTIANGTYVQMKATAIYENNTTQDVTDAATWSVIPGGDGTDTTVDDVTTKGLVQGIATGTDTIRAHFDTLDGDATVTVTSATLQYLVISAAGSKTSIAGGTKLQFSVTGIFSDNSTQDLTNDPAMLWGSSNTGIAAFGGGSDPAGLITAVAPGVTQVSATLGTIDSQNYELTVTNATLDYITIYPPNSTTYVIAYGTTVQFTATGHFSDTSTQDITNQVDWDSSVGTIASIDSTGLAQTATATGDTTITAYYPKGGSGDRPTDSTNLRVISMPLTSITITPSSKSTYVGDSFQYTAMGTFTDPTPPNNTYNIDITNLVVWQSDNAALAISNSAGSYGLATPLSAGSANVQAKRGEGVDEVDSNISLVTIAASDTVAPTMVSAQLLSGDRVKVTFSEPMDHTTATALANYKVATTSTVAGVCSDNSNFDTTIESISITDVIFFTQSVYILQLGDGTSATQYTLIGDKDNLTDVAAVHNHLGCSNTATFNGIDTVKPYLVSVVNSEPSKIIVKYSEPMTIGGGTTAADRLSNYTLAEDPSNSIPGDDVTIQTIDMINESTFILNLNQGAQSIKYRLTVDAAVTDQAPTPNVMGSPRILTLMGNEQLKVVSAEAIDLTHVKVTFSKPVLSGNDVTNSAECNDATECHTKYKLYPRNGAGTEALLGDITSAVRGTGNETNTVILTHATQQEGIAYTVVTANLIDGDGFNNVADGQRIKAEAGTTDFMQASPKDRASFIGLGDVIDEISDGEYFTDPFADGSVFTWSFVYDGRVYLGTNDRNTAAFRFDPNGLNSVLVTFDFSDLTALLCPDTNGFGYITTASTGITDNAWPQCANVSYPDNSGPDGEVGVVGFNAIYPDLNNDDVPDYELLIAGPLKNNVNHVFYTQDVDTDLNWKYTSITGTNGLNSKSVQTIYGHNKYLFTGISSSHNSIIPIMNRYIITESGGILSVSIPSEVLLTGSVINDPVANGDVAGIDAIVIYKNYMYAANNGGVVRAPRTSWDQADSGGTDLTFSWTTVTPQGLADTTLQLPAYLTTTGGGLGKISPGQKGYPIFLVYNDRLYLARNVAQGSADPANKTNYRGELWVCDPTRGGADTTNPNTCEAADWTRIISGNEADLPNTGTNGAIALLQNNGSGRLYVGFDNPSGVSVWRTATTTPEATSLHSNRMDFNDADPNTGWVMQGVSGFGNSHTKMFSSTTINDGTYDYIYLTAGDDTNAIRVYRQRE